MHLTGRTAWAFLVLAAGAAAAVLLPAPIAGCLGPLGVTAIQCAEATGVLPSVSPGLIALSAAALLAALIAIPDPAGSWPRRVAAAGTGAAVGMLGYVLLRPTTWTDLTSTGSTVTLALPFDTGGLAVAGLVGATAGLLVAWVGASDRRA
jgi:hypothetical protein